MQQSITNDQLVADVQKAMATSMMQRAIGIAADLVGSGMTPEAALMQAVATAKQQEEVLALSITAPVGWKQQESAAALKHEMAGRVYTALRMQPAPLETKNSRWLACAEAMGREPTTIEYLTWKQA